MSLRRFQIYFCLQGLLTASLTLTQELLNSKCCPRVDQPSDMGAFQRLRYLSLLQFGKICPLGAGAYSITGLMKPLDDLGICGNSAVILALLCWSISSINFQCSGWWRRLRAFFTFTVFSFSSLSLPYLSPSRCLPLLLLLLLLFDFLTFSTSSSGQRTVSSSIPGAKRMALALGVTYGLTSVELSCESVHPMLFLLLYYIMPSNKQGITKYCEFHQLLAKQCSIMSCMLDLERIQLYQWEFQLI